MNTKKVKKFIKHVRFNSNLSNEHKDFIVFILTDTPCNKGGKYAYEYNFVYKLRGSQLDGFLLSKLRNIAKIKNVNSVIIKNSEGNDLSFYERMTDEYFEKTKDDLKKGDFALKNAINIGIWMGKKSIVYSNNYKSLGHLISEIWKLETLDQKKQM